MVEFYGSSCITQKYLPVKCLYFYIFMHFLTTSLNFNMLSQKIILCCCSIVHHVINPCCSPLFFFMEVQEVELHQVIVDSLIRFFIELFFLIRLVFLLITIVNSCYIYMPNHISKSWVFFPFHRGEQERVRLMLASPFPSMSLSAKVFVEWWYGVAGWGGGDACTGERHDDGENGRLELIYFFW